MRVLSVFDGISCGLMAFRRAGVPVEEYHAFEIDPHAVRCSQHNFPEVIRHGDGDVFKADFREFRGVDFLIGGSPCTYWSVAQKKDIRETEAHGMGWELFQQYVRALREAKPRYFIYENNKSMADAIKKEISETFGFGPVMINSSLVSAQNRERYYWVGKRMADGTYAKVKVEQPEDMHLVLKDVLDSGYADRDKGHAVIASAGRTTYREYFLKNQGNVALERADPKAFSMTGDFGNRRASVNDKAYCPAANPSSDMSARVIEFAPCEELAEEYYKGGFDGNLIGMIENDSVCRNGKQPSQQYRVYSCEGTSVCVDCDQRKHYIVPVGDTQDNKSCAIKAQYYKNSVANFITNGKYNATGVAEGSLTDSEKKIYDVKDGMITIKDKQYPIKLPDGSYIIRKLSVDECKRLQTIPEDYDMKVISNTQAYKCIGNGWTVNVIVHLIQSALRGDTDATQTRLC